MVTDVTLGTFSFPASAYQARQVKLFGRAVRRADREGSADLGGRAVGVIAALTHHQRAGPDRLEGDRTPTDRMRINGQKAGTFRLMLARTEFPTLMRPNTIQAKDPVIPDLICTMRREFGSSYSMQVVDGEVSRRGLGLRAGCNPPGGKPIDHAVDRAAVTRGRGTTGTRSESRGQDRLSRR